MSISTDSDFRWTAKGDWQTSAYRNLLCNHIKEGGTGEDDVGSEIIMKYIGAMMLSSDFRDLMARFRFDTLDLHSVISSAISAGLRGDIPSPFIQDGFAKVLGCVLLEKKPAIIEIIHKVAETETRHIDAAKEKHGDTAEARDCAIVGRFNAISEATIEVGRFHHDYITKKNGSAYVTINPNGKGLPTSDAPGGGCGCAPLLILGGIVLSSGALVSAVFSALVYRLVH